MFEELLLPEQTMADAVGRYIEFNKKVLTESGKELQPTVMLLIEEKATGKKGQVYTVVGGSFDSKEKKISTMYFLGKTIVEKGYNVELVCSSNDSFMATCKEEDAVRYKSLGDMPDRLEALVTTLQTVNGRKSMIVEPYDRKDGKIIFDSSKRQIISRDGGSDEVNLNLLNYFWKGYFGIEDEDIDLTGHLALSIRCK